VLRLGHKYLSRVLQKEVVPEAAPDFWLVDPDGAPPEDIRYPCFLKPVKGAFSVHTGKIGGAAELESFLRRQAIGTFRRQTMAIFNTLVGEVGSLAHDGSKFIAEGLLSGVQVTVEGWVQGGNPRIFGIVDSVVDPATGSFIRFDYPSSLSILVQRRMRDIAKRLIRGSTLDDTVFNIEMFYEQATDTVSIIEVNPRLCGQFADLYQKVDGTSSYNVAMNVALGRKPRFDRGDGPFELAASVPLRIFRPSRVVFAPDDDAVDRIAKAHPGTLIWSEVETGMALTDFETYEDGKSARFAVINLGAASRSGLLDKVEALHRELGFVFEEV
jgi:hypothetical protein